MGLYRHRSIFNDGKHIIDIDFQLQSFTDYIKITEKIIEKEIKDKINSYNKFLQEASDIEIEHEYDIVDHKTKIHIHQLYYNSIFISLYSFLEKKMYQLCKLAEKNQSIKVKDLSAEKNQSIKVKDLSGEGIFKYYKYFKKVLHIDLENLNKDWTLITKYNKLRNRLVHFPQTIIEKSENNTKQIETLKSIINLKIIDKGDYIEFEISDKQLLLNFSGVINNFLRNIYFEKDTSS